MVNGGEGSYISQTHTSRMSEVFDFGLEWSVVTLVKVHIWLTLVRHTVRGTLYQLNRLIGCNVKDEYASHILAR